MVEKKKTELYDLMIEYEKFIPNPEFVRRYIIERDNCLKNLSLTRENLNLVMDGIMFNLRRELIKLKSSRSSIH